MEGGVGRTAYAISTVGGDIHVIMGVGGQAEEVDYSVIGINGVASTVSKAGRTHHQGPAGGIALLFPHDVGGVAGNIDGSQIVDRRTVRYVLHSQVVEVGIAVFTVGRHDGYAGAGDGVHIVGE